MGVYFGSSEGTRQRIKLRIDVQLPGIRAAGARTPDMSKHPGNDPYVHPTGVAGVERFACCTADQAVFTSSSSSSHEPPQ